MKSNQKIPVYDKIPDRYKYYIELYFKNEKVPFARAGENCSFYRPVLWLKTKEIHKQTRLLYTMELWISLPPTSHFIPTLLIPLLPFFLFVLFTQLKMTIMVPDAFNRRSDQFEDHFLGSMNIFFSK